jgi:hypothetical protein
MVRDELKNRAYYDKEIEELIHWREISKNDLKEGNYKEGFKGSVANGIYDDSLSKCFAIYSRGDSIEEIKKSCLELVDDYYLAYKNGGIDYKYYHPRHEGPELINTLSLAILCDVDGKHLEKLLEVAKTAPKLQIINHFLNYWGEGEEVEEAHRFDRGYSGLNKMFTLANEEVLSKKLMQKYLKNWYGSDHRVLLRETYEHDNTNYVGYWAFEAAAFVKMRGLDDSSFKDNVYYPKDMITLDKI